MRSIFRPMVLLALLVLCSGFVYAQGITTSLSGMVVDPTDAVIPGVDIVVKNNATTAQFQTTSGENGTFTIPALNPGVYTVTASLPGFKTIILNSVVLNAGTPASVRVKLEVGSHDEQIVVEAAGDIVQTQSSSVAVTMEASRIVNLPLSTRSAMDFLVLLPGVQTPGNSRDSQINGLPKSAISVTWDGVNVQDNYLKTSDGFFSVMEPRLDAIEEVTLTTAAQGSETTGQGAARINFVTRSGSNEFRGSAYHYFQKDALNSNTWVRNRDGLPKANLLQNQPGFRLGGPVIIPGVFNGRDKLFFFVNYEQLRQPSEFTSTRTILHPVAQQGTFRYNLANGGVQEVNLLDLASRNGQLATVDPVVAKLLADISAATGKTGAINPATNPSLQSYSFAGASSQYNYYPTVRIDYNLSQKHRLTSTTNYQNFENFPDNLNSQEVRFPGFPNTAGQTSWRRSISFSVRSTLTSKLVNEARVAFVNYNVDFSAGVAASQFNGPVASQNGYNLSLGLGLTSATTQASASGRQAPVREYLDTLSWAKGRHNMSIGGSLTTAKLYQWSQTLVPGITFGVDSSEAANNMFTVANFPNATTGNLNDARSLYALLTGRVASITGNAVLNESGQYEYNGDRTQKGRVNEMGFFFQDAWHLRRNLTVNAGVRWELQMPFQPDADNYTTAGYADVFGESGLDSAGKPNLFKPGVLAGHPTEFVPYGKGSRAYKIAYGNVAPTVGIAWTPSADGGFLGLLLGRAGDSVIRAGYAKAFSRNGMSDYSGIFGSNPGSQLTATRSVTLGNLNLDGQGLPVLFRQDNRLGPPPFAKTPDYPLTVAKGTAQITNSVNVFDPNMKTPYSHSWNIGWQRAITHDMSVEVRYAGTRGRALWATQNYNEFNIIDNGFLDEFKKAQGNLQANIAAGRGNTFAYTGAPGTSPLPTFLAFFNGVVAAQAGAPASYTGSNWTNSSFLGYLAARNPQPYNFASASSSTSTPGLLGDATRRAQAAAAGLPANYFVVNPGLLGGANVRTNRGFSHYDALQIELRRRMSQGLLMQASYAYGNTYVSDFYSIRKPLLESIDTGSPGSVPHSFKSDWVYELPIGSQKRFAAGAGPLLNRIIGGWSAAGTGRIQSGQVVDFGNVRLVGVTKKELQQMYGRYEYPQIFTQNAPMRIYRLPQDIIENTSRANDVSATSATGYGPQGPPSGRYLAPANGPDCIETISGFGDCGSRVVNITGPMNWFLDLSAVKRVQITERVNAEFRGEFLNAFNHATMNGGTTGTVTPSASRTIQLVSRVNW